MPLNDHPKPHRKKKGGKYNNRTERMRDAGAGAWGNGAKLTTDVRDKLVRAYAALSSMQTAANYAGVHITTLAGWIDRGLAHESPYDELVQLIAEAQGNAVVEKGEEYMLNHDDWKARATLLERRLPDEFGRRQAVEHSGHVVNISVNADDMAAAVSAAKEFEETMWGDDPAGSSDNEDDFLGEDE